jgi:hypothetical protein
VIPYSAPSAARKPGNKAGAFDLISGLLDKDTGVRKFVLKAIGTSTMPALKEKVRLVSLNDPNEQIRKLAQQVYEKLETPNNPSAL